MTLRSCVSLSCSSVMAAEKDVRKAIRSVVAKLPNIQKLKPEQEPGLLSFVCLIILTCCFRPVSVHDIRHDHMLAIGFGRS